MAVLSAYVLRLTEKLLLYRSNFYTLSSRSGFTYSEMIFGQLTNTISIKSVPADYDGDGKTDVTVFRDGTWFSLNSTNGLTVKQFGTASDTPTESLYLP